MEQSDDTGMREVYVYFVPTSDIKMFTLDPMATIRDLKTLSEEKCGIPSDLFILMHKTTVPQDSARLLDLGSPEYMLFDLLIQPVWEKLVLSCIKGEKHQVMARVQIKMNQLSPEARAFVAAFIAAYEGHLELFRLLIESKKKEVMYETVRLSGRSLLHAAVMGGNISCVTALVTSSAWSLLRHADEHRESPLDMAHRLNKGESLLEILKKYNDMNIDGRHCRKDGPQEDGNCNRLAHPETREGSSTSGTDDAGKESLGSATSSPVGGRRLLNRGAVPCANRIPAAPTHRRNGVSRMHHQLVHAAETMGGNTERSGDAPWLPSVTVDGGRGPHTDVKYLKGDTRLRLKGVHDSLLDDTERDRSSSTPLPLQPFFVRRRRTRSSSEEDQRCNVMMRPDSPPSPRLSSSAPHSPVVLKKQQSLPLSPLVQPNSPSAYRRWSDYHEPRRCDVRQLPVHACHKSRESLPWNAWKTVRASDESSIKSCESEPICEYQRMSNRQKSFEAWLVAKEDERTKRQMEAQNEFKRMTERKAVEEAQRRTRTKTFDEWLKEKEAIAKPVKDWDDDVTEADREARRTHASFKYQRWMKKKDDEALAREERILEQERKKYEELKKKREKNQSARSPKEKLVKAKSLPL